MKKVSKEKRREYMARYYANHPEAKERNREANKRWREAHREKCREYQRKCVAKKRAEREAAEIAAAKREARLAKKRERGKRERALRAEREAANPELREARLAKNREQARVRYYANIEKERARARKSMRLVRIRHGHDYDAKWRAAHKADIAARTMEAYWFGGRKERLRENERKRRLDAEYRLRQALRRRRLKEKRRENKTIRLCDLDLEALALFMKRGVQPAWKRRVDYGSRYCPDALIDKTGNMEAEDIRAAELRGYGFELAIERKDRREAAGGGGVLICA